MSGQRFRVLRGGAVATGVLGFAGLLSGLLLGPQVVLRGLYFGSYFWLHVSLGCIAILCMGDLSGGRWVERMGPVLRVGRLGMIVALPMFLLSLLGAGWIFPWTGGEAHLEGTKATFFSLPFFAGRMALFTLIFVFLAFCGGRAARNIAKRRHGEHPPARRTSGAGFVLYAFCGLFFAVDAVMSLEPEWYSTGFPVVLMASQVFAAYCLCLAAYCLLIPPLERLPLFFGSLLLAMLMFWLYVTFLQFLIIWMGNLTEDISWYLARREPFWVGLSGFLAVFSFVVPFGLLLQKRVKRSPRALGWIAVALFTGQLLYIAWCILPSWEADWLQGAVAAAGVLAVGGVWLWSFLGKLGKEALDD